MSILEDIAVELSLNPQKNPLKSPVFLYHQWLQDFLATNPVAKN